MEIDMETLSDESSSSPLPPSVEKEVMNLVERLTEIQTHLEFISIVVMNGKVSSSDLARQACCHPSVISHFPILGWSFSFEVYVKRDLLLFILNYIIEITQETLEMSDEMLGQQLNKLLMGGRFLIVFLNTRDAAIAWDDLKIYLPENEDGSKIVFTNWPQSVAFSPHVHSQPHLKEQSSGLQLYYVGVQQVEIFSDGSSSIAMSSGSVKIEMIIKEVMNLVERLTEIQTHLECISIVVMNGKMSSSDLVRQVRFHPSIVSHFPVRACSFSYWEYRKRDLLLCILNFITEITFENLIMSNEMLGQLLNKLLMGGRFLIFFCNTWDATIAWDDLKIYIPDNKDGSKIVFTDWPQSIAFSPQVHRQPHLEEETSGLQLYYVGAQQDDFFSDGSSTIAMSSGSVKDEMIVGFEDEVMNLVDRLTGLQKHLELISIVGMPGLGKTTLAKQVYNHPAVVYHFHVRAWTHVSQAYQKRDLLLGILSSVVELTSDIYEMSDGKLLELLKKQLLGHRYLIVMDDVWDNGAWDDLRRSFPDDKMGSKIMFTSRVTELALHAQPNSHSCYLRFLTRSESWELLCQKVFQRKHCPGQLMEIGMQIAEKCKGLPLAIVVIAGILANEKTLTWWTEVAKSVSSYIVGNPEQFMDTIALSYNHLPRHLKTCFLYFGAFLEDHEIPVRKLIWLWVAEGFIPQSGSKRVEDVAEDYFMDLINRSLIMVSKKGSNGGIKSCIMHDLLRELCLRKVKEENFMQRLFKYDDDSNSSNPFSEKPGHLCIYSAAFPHSSLMPFAPNATSLLCFAVDALPDFTSSICQAFKFLRVLDLSSFKIPLFPREIIQLVELRYIALHAEVASPPSSISNLQYLETFIVSSRTNVTLPRNTSKMVNLRHIYITPWENEIECPSFEEVQCKDGCPLILENLQTLSYLCPSRSCEDVLARAPHLRKLGLCGRLISESRDLKFPKLDSSNHLETLKLFNTAFYPEASSSCNPIMFPERLKKLTLTNTALAWNEMWTLGMLPNLEVLKLKLHACMGPRWETNDGGFPRLKFLKFQDLKIEQWIASNDHFPCLQHLVLHGCRQLEEIPFSLGDIPTLETIEVCWCSETAANSAREIKKDQEDMGNDCLKIITKGQTG